MTRVNTHAPSAHSPARSPGARPALALTWHRRRRRRRPADMRAAARRAAPHGPSVPQGVSNHPATLVRAWSHIPRTRCALGGRAQLSAAAARAPHPALLFPVLRFPFSSPSCCWLPPPRLPLELPAFEAGTTPRSRPRLAATPPHTACLGHSARGFVTHTHGLCSIRVCDRALTHP